MIIDKFNKNPRGKAAYKLGYPDRFQIADFSKRYKTFNDELMRELLKDFCREMDIKDNNFIESVIQTFKKKCYS